ncbi:hypothetical protein ACFQU7_01950 [Pseudoroseomonas wenyumeiae]
MLDEVDAPLDDANVERLCGLLEIMASESGTRFLVVTHHPLTMARMHRLYGVTMQERGVSRLLSVDLGAAVEMVEGQGRAEAPDFTPCLPGRRSLGSPRHQARCFRKPARCAAAASFSLPPLC